MAGMTRFAVIGLGHIAQVAVLPAFEHAEGCELAALVSSDAEKLAELGKRYAVEHRGSYDDLERIFAAGDIDAAYIALPNSMHRTFTERCARAGVHVLCEKPMAGTVEDCEAMIHVCDENDVKLMIAYRLHFDRANLEAIEIVQSGRIGEPRFFSSTFGQQVREGDIRTRPELDGGALFDMGIYCINAARYLFRDEPVSVMAVQTSGHGASRRVDETTTAILTFPGNRFAQITASQGSGDVDEYRIVGAKGDLHVQPAYTYYGERIHRLTIGEDTKEKSFPKSDQFAPELVHFAECIDGDVALEPSGWEGFADVRVMQAIQESARTGQAVTLEPAARSQRPGPRLAMQKPPVKKPKTVRVESPSK